MVVVFDESETGMAVEVETTLLPVLVIPYVLPSALVVTITVVYCCVKLVGTVVE